MLACFWATKRLRSFLWGVNYTLRTDHKPLVIILTTKGFASERTSHRINRWSSRMLEYNFNVEYLPGVNDVLADCLSRLPLKAQPEEYSHDMPDDECIAQIPKWPQRKKLSGNLLTLYDVADELSIKDGMLHRGDRIVIPDELQLRVIQLAHEGHFGMTLVRRRLREYHWWPAMDRHIEESATVSTVRTVTKVTLATLHRYSQCSYLIKCGSNLHWTSWDRSMIPNTSL